MALYEDLQWLEEELLEEELEEEEEAFEEDLPRRRVWKSRRKECPEEPASMTDREAVYVEKKKREKGITGLKFLAFLEILAILAVIWGWIQWLY